MKEKKSRPCLMKKTRVIDDKGEKCIQYSYQCTSHMSASCLLLTLITIIDRQWQRAWAEEKTDDDHYHMIDRVYNHENKLDFI